MESKQDLEFRLRYKGNNMDFKKLFDRLILFVKKYYKLKYEIIKYQKRIWIKPLKEFKKVLKSH